MSVVMFLLATLILAQVAAAAPRGGGGHGARGGGHGHFHGSRSHFHSRSHSHFGVRLGVFAPWWGWPYYGYAPYYPPYYSAPPYYVAPSYYVEAPSYTAPPVTYSTSERHWWYYCAPSQAYYPYVNSCPVEWERVQPYPPSVSPENPAPSD
jgi:hypothetical protein